MLRRFTPILAFTALCWLVLAVNHLLLNDGLLRYGIIPRRISGLPGIFTAPFLHGSYHHLAANTLPLLILGGILCARNKAEFGFVTATGTVLGGLLTWVFARQASHIGASGLIFCYFGYIGSQAYFNRTPGAVLLSIVCVVGYGGMLRGLFPTTAAISWEAHVSGLLAGIALAWLVAKVKKEPAKPLMNPN